MNNINIIIIIIVLDSEWSEECIDFTFTIMCFFLCLATFLIGK